jgi:SHS2 domain-containing protein
MPWRFLEGRTTADVAFSAEGRTIEELFVSAAEAVLATMVEHPLALAPREVRTVSLSAESAEMLLFELLQTVIFHKDAERLLLRVVEVSIHGPIEGSSAAPVGSTWSCTATLRGEKADRNSHELLADVKAVTLQGYRVTPTASGWEAEVILDV